MNKESFCWVLQSALLRFDKMPDQELLELIPDKRLALIGFKLAGQLENYNLGEVEAPSTKPLETYTTERRAI